MKITARRKWAERSQALIIVNDPKHFSIKETSAAEMLGAAGLNVSIMKPKSDSPSGLVKAVQSWDADSIFIGYGGTNEEIFGRREFQSETEELLRRTNCSVELVRKTQAQPKALSVAA